MINFKTFSASDLKLMTSLLSANSPSSHENDINEIICQELNKFAGITKVSVLKNISFSFAKLNNKKPIVVFDAHTDEVGFGVSRIKGNGTIRALNYGGIDFHVLPASRFILTNARKEHFSGVASVIPLHLQRSFKNKKNQKIDDIIFDFGFSSKADVLKHHINCGDRIIFDAPVKFLVNERILSKAVDNRIGCFLLLKLIAYLTNIQQSIVFQPVFLFSSQEEVGARGSKTFCLPYLVDLAIVIDTSPVVDQFDHVDDDTKIGNGILLKAMDVGHITNQKIFTYQRNLLEENQIKYQFYISKGATNASVLHILNDGIACMQIAVAARNLHTGASIFDCHDLLSALNFLKIFATKTSASNLSSFKQL